MTASASSSAQTPAKANNSCRRTSVRTSKMLQARELCGNRIPFNKGRCNFNEEFQKAQACHPVVWKYQETKELSDGALGRICMNCEALPPTPNPKRSCTILRGACEVRYSSALCSLELTHLRDLSCQPERTAIYDFGVLNLVNCFSRINSVTQSPQLCAGEELKGLREIRMTGQIRNALIPKVMVWVHGFDHRNDCFTCADKCEGWKNSLTKVLQMCKAWDFFL